MQNTQESIAMTISSQAPKGEGSETTGLPDCRSKAAPKRPAPEATWDDDIVRSSRKREAVLKLIVKQIKISQTGCWEWQGGKRNGYGSFVIPELNDGKKILAHRASYVAFKGQTFPEGKFACHHCDNPACVNPDHIFVGTAKDNLRDCARKGRTSSAVPKTAKINAQTKYTQEEIRNAKKLIESGMPGKDVSKHTGISPTHVSRIKRGYARVSETPAANTWIHPNRKYNNDQLTNAANMIVEGVLRNRQIADVLGVSIYLIQDMRKGKVHKEFMKRALCSEQS